MDSSAGTTAAGPVGRSAVPDGLTTRNVSPASGRPSATAVTRKEAEAEADPAGMMTVKSGTAAKSSNPAEPAATATGTTVAEAGCAGCPAPPKPTREAVTRTSVSTPSAAAVGVRDRVMRLSPSRMVISDPITNSPGAVPIAVKVSGPSNPASSAAVMSTVVEPRRWPAAMVTAKPGTAVKSAACALPAATDAVTVAASAGKGG